MSTTARFFTPAPIRLFLVFIIMNLSSPASAFSVLPTVQNDRATIISAASLIQRKGPRLMTQQHNLDADAPRPEDDNLSSRRSLFQISSVALLTTIAGTTLSTPFNSGALAAATETGKSLDASIYTILRVREATEQETRLVNSGKFKDLQRANVKLAVRFMLNNYRLADNFVAASAFLEGNKRIQAGDIGQSAVQSLYTILEYFDSSDVENLRVGAFDSMAGKEVLVLKGLEAARKSIDEFLAYFPKDVVDSAKTKIQEENDLNAKEFDPELGAILNPNPKV